MIGKIKKLLLSPWTAVITLTLITTLRVLDPAFVESVRLRYFDTLITQAREPAQQNIVTVNINEDALDKYGQWPLPRGEYAKIIEDLYKRNAGLVVWNVLMPNPDRMGQDGILAQTLKQYPVVLPSSPASQTRNSPRNPGSAVLGPQFQDRIVQYPGLIANTEIIENSAAGVGIVNTLPEVDGVNRRVPLVVSVDGRIYPSLGMETLRIAAGDSTVQVKLNELGVEKMRIPKFGPITTDSLGRIWIDWQQKSTSYNLLELPKDLGGAIVIVGTTAAGLSNPVPTSRGALFPHEAQASILATMTSGTVINRPDYADGVEILAIILSGLLLLFMTRWIYVGLSSIIVLVSGSLVASWFAYSHSLWLFDATAYVSAIILVGLHAYGVKFVSEFLQKQQIKKQFGTYLSPAMVEKLQKNPDLLQLGGDSRELSIMFTDVRGFTAISEHYGRDVQGLTKIMNRYMTAMTRKIIQNNGTLDKYIGDAQMAFWNAPLDDSKHAKNAVKTALEMMGSLDEFNREVAAEGVPAFGMGLGINTDTVVVGNMGSDQRFDYTCLGDGVNLASRLEGQSKPYGVKIVLGPKTAEQIEDEYFVLELDCIAVKGKTQGVNIFTVLGTKEELSQEFDGARGVHELMIDCYRRREWELANKLIENLCGSFNGMMDAYYEMMQERIGELRDAGLGEDWDGTYRATSK